MARLRANNGGGETDDTYTRTTKVLSKKGSPETKKYTPEPAFTNDKTYGNKSPEEQKRNEQDSMKRNPGFKRQMTEAQKNEQDSFKYKKEQGDRGFKEGKEYKSGTTQRTPGTPDEYAEKKQVSITHKRDVQSSNGHPGKAEELKKKGYVNQPGTYNYEKPERQEWVDEDKAEEHLKANPGARRSNPDQKAEQKKAAATVAAKKKKVKYVRGGGTM